MLSLVINLNICALLLLIGDFDRLMDGYNNTLSYLNKHAVIQGKVDCSTILIKKSVDLLLYTVDFNSIIMILPFNKLSDCCHLRDRMVFLFDLAVI